MTCLIKKRWFAFFPEILRTPLSVARFIRQLFKEDILKWSDRTYSFDDELALIGSPGTMISAKYFEAIYIVTVNLRDAKNAWFCDNFAVEVYNTRIGQYRILKIRRALI